MNARRTIISILILAILLAARGTAYAQSTDVQYFAETGHSIKDVFLKFYNAASDPKLVYGYPITEQMISKDGKTVQYFQRARFELAGNQTVQLTPLGTLTYKPTSPLTINNPNACKLFNNIPVCFDFLKFYEASGGPAQFGNPISPFESSSKIIVQYFEGVRFEWRADRPEGQRVVISDLGRIYFDQLKEDPAQLKAVEQFDATINPVLSLNIRAFVLKSVTFGDGQQTVYIVVHNQTSKPVEAATGKALVKFTDGTTQEFTFTTNARGIAQITFNFNGQKSGELVPIEISVAYQSLNAATKTSFRIWF
jgi:hypothetical protein